MQEKSILIGCPVRNRAWILPEYLECLENIDYPADKIKFCFIVNDSIDDTEAILTEFSRRSLSPVQIINTPDSKNNGHQRGTYRLEQLAKLRNLLLEKFFQSECEYLLSVDSDILVPPSIIRQLLSRDCLIISALVCNGHHINDSSIYNVMQKNPVGNYQYMKDFPRDNIFRTDITGAAYLIHRSVIVTHRVYYSAKRGAEDIGFCEEARARGIPIFCDGTIECRHVMNEPGGL
ncbi:MAG: hypothetical protein PHU36_00780 [Syntrophomonadaceae bacterium]|nr:hypothetical protein [Syntrophomonadaceae bacterium]